MKMMVKLMGVERELTIASRNSRSLCRFAIDGSEYSADVAAVGPGVYSILFAGRSFEIKLETIGDRRFAHMEGRRLEVAVRPARRSSVHRAAMAAEGRQEVVSVIPGKLVDVLVAAGEEVQAGRGLVIVEAMKMQNEIRSPKTGKVTKLPLAKGASVAAGDVLAVVE